MTRYISILRGINVGGKRKILMAELKLLFQKLGYLNISTYIQSGNVIFDLEEKSEVKKIENDIQEAILKTFKFEVPVIIRSVDELKQITSINPFIDKDDPDSLYLTFLKDIPEKDTIEKINKYSFPPDKFILSGKDVFISCSEKYSDSKLSNTFFEKHLKVAATTRNWKTVNKLYEIATIS